MVDGAAAVSFAQQRTSRAPSLTYQLSKRYSIIREGYFPKAIAQAILCFILCVFEMSEKEREALTVAGRSGGGNERIVLFG